MLMINPPIENYHNGLRSLWTSLASLIPPRWRLELLSLSYYLAMTSIRCHIRDALRGLSTDSSGGRGARGDDDPPPPPPPASGVNRGNTVVRQLERRVVNLQGQVVDLHSRILESEKKMAMEKRAKLGAGVKRCGNNGGTRVGRWESCGGTLCWEVWHSALTDVASSGSALCWEMWQAVVALCFERWHKWCLLWLCRKTIFVALRGGVWLWYAVLFHGVLFSLGP